MILRELDTGAYSPVLTSPESIAPPSLDLDSEIAASPKLDLNPQPVWLPNNRYLVLQRVLTYDGIGYESIRSFMLSGVVDLTAGQQQHLAEIREYQVGVGSELAMKGVSFSFKSFDLRLADLEIDPALSHGSDRNVVGWSPSSRFLTGAMSATKGHYEWSQDSISDLIIYPTGDLDKPYVLARPVKPFTRINLYVLADQDENSENVPVARGYRIKGTARGMENKPILLHKPIVDITRAQRRQITILAVNRMEVKI